MHLMPPSITESLGRLKKDILRGKEVSLDLDETLIALGISASGNPAAQIAIEKTPAIARLRCAHDPLPTPGDEAGMRKLGINLTSDPGYPAVTCSAGRATAVCRQPFAIP